MSSNSWRRRSARVTSSSWITSPPTRSKAILAAGAGLLYLPPYSPDLNPIEQLFAKLKTLLRKAAARSREALWTTIGNLLNAFSPDECRNYLVNCGYALE